MTSVRQFDRHWLNNARPFEEARDLADMAAARPRGTRPDDDQGRILADGPVLDRHPVAKIVRREVDPEVQHSRDAVDVDRFYGCELGAQPFAQLVHGVSPHQATGRHFVELPAELRHRRSYVRIPTQKIHTSNKYISPHGCTCLLTAVPYLHQSPSYPPAKQSPSGHASHQNSPSAISRTISAAINNACFIYHPDQTNPEIKSIARRRFFLAARTARSRCFNLESATSSRRSPPRLALPRPLLGVGALIWSRASDRLLVMGGRP